MLSSKADVQLLHDSQPLQSLMLVQLLFPSLSAIAFVGSVSFLEWSVWCCEETRFEMDCLGGSRVDLRI
jgi:hypothetical protein